MIQEKPKKSEILLCNAPLGQNPILHGNVQKQKLMKLEVDNLVSLHLLELSWVLEVALNHMKSSIYIFFI
jgi:hypothetical protein